MAASLTSPRRRPLRSKTLRPSSSVRKRKSSAIENRLSPYNLTSGTRDVLEWCDFRAGCALHGRQFYYAASRVEAAARKAKKKLGKGPVVPRTILARRRLSCSGSDR